MFILTQNCLKLSSLRLRKREESQRIELIFSLNTVVLTESSDTVTLSVRELFTLKTCCDQTSNASPCLKAVVLYPFWCLVSTTLSSHNLFQVSNFFVRSRSSISSADSVDARGGIQRSQQIKLSLFSNSQPTPLT